MKLMCTVDDLKEMGIPLGPRKKIAKFVKEKANKQVSLTAFSENSSVKLPNQNQFNMKMSPLLFVTYLLATHQAAQEKEEVKVASQEVVPSQVSGPLPEPSAMKLPVVGTVSSIHVDYNYFEVGTGQVNHLPFFGTSVETDATYYINNHFKHFYIVVKWYYTFAMKITISLSPFHCIGICGVPLSGL